MLILPLIHQEAFVKEFSLSFLSLIPLSAIWEEWYLLTFKGCSKYGKIIYMKHFENLKVLYKC